MTRIGVAGDRGLSVDYDVNSHTVLHAGGAITTILPNLWQDNFVTGAFRSRPVFTPTRCPMFLCLSRISCADQSAAAVYHRGPASVS